MAAEKALGSFSQCVLWREVSFEEVAAMGFQQIKLSTRSSADPGPSEWKEEVTVNIKTWSSKKRLQGLKNTLSGEIKLNFVVLC